MAFDGSGNFTRDNGTNTGSTTWADDDAAGIDITTTNHDTHDQDIANGLSNCICRDGQSTISANIPFNNKKITGLANGTAATDAANLGTVQKGAIFWGGTSGGSANAHTITLSPSISSYSNGLRVAFLSGATNTAGATLNVNGVGAVNIQKYDGGTDLEPGDLLTNHIVEVVYSPTPSAHWHLVSYPEPNFATWNPTYGASGSMTWTSISTNYAKYLRRGNIVYFTINATGTIGGTASSDLTFSLPVDFASTSIAGPAIVFNNSSSGTFGYWSFSGTSTVVVRLSGATNWTQPGTASGFVINGYYEAA